MRQLVSAMAVAILCAACSASEAPVSPSAANGGAAKKNPGSINLQVVFYENGDADGDGVISHGDFITYTFNEDADWFQLSTACYQDGALVASALQTRQAFLPAQLSSRSWAEGAADCTAELQKFGNNGIRTVALISYAVAE